MHITCVTNYITYNESNALAKKYNTSNRHIHVILTSPLFQEIKKKYIYEKSRIGHGIWNVELWVLSRTEKMITKSETGFFDSLPTSEKSSCLRFCYSIHPR